MKAPRTSLLLLTALLAGVGAARGQTAISVNDPTSNFTPIKGISGSILADPQWDQQTGQPSDDFVGTADTWGFMMEYGTHNGVDALAFRVRLNQYSSQWTNNNYLRLGFDATGDGSIDLYFGMAKSYINFFGADPAALNVSPNTSGFVALSSSQRVLADATNFAYVSAPNLFPDTKSSTGTTDALVTFIVTFSQINSALAELNLPSVNPNSAFLFVAITSTQANSVNQDAYGYVGGDYSVRFDQVAAPLRGDGSPVPEPATVFSTGALLLVGGVLWWRRRCAIPG